MAEVIVGDLAMNSTEMFEGTIAAFPDPLGLVDNKGAPAQPDMTNTPPEWIIEGNWGEVRTGADVFTGIQLRSADGIPNDEPPRTGRAILRLDADRGAGIETVDLIWNMSVNGPVGARVAGLGGNPFGSGPVPKV